ncbi:MAG TPA: ABC transporter substrate-binding protein [Humisphaera sp.]|jgi:ABC-type Fe3+ transport system substrate-binding protein|nr:ABC transporter substrate-binding protein [Humisphaera sp.]
MMRYLPIILFALVLAAPFALRSAVMRRETSTTDANAERLVIVTPHPDDIRREFARAFDRWHREKFGSGVSIDYRVPGGSTDVRRLLEAVYQPFRDKTTGRLAPDAQVGIDVVFGGGDFFFDSELKPLGVLQPMHLPTQLLADAFPQPALAGVKLYDSSKAPDGSPAPMWVGSCLSSFGILYNPDIYRALGLPEPSEDHGWQDLTDPRLAGLLALADPSHSGSAAVAYEMVIQRAMADAEADIFAREPSIKALSKADLSKNAAYQAAIAAGWKRGMAQLLKIAANARYFTDSSPIVPLDVSRGDSAAGIGIDYYARVTAEMIGASRVRFIAPIGATAITPDPVAILHGVSGRRLELATHFIEYCLSQEGQRLWILKPGTPGGPEQRGLRRPPVRSDVYRDQTNWTDDVNPFKTAAGFNQRGDWMVLFTDTRPIWVAAWIDSRDALIDAYHQILKVTDPQKRQQLIDELADLPVEMSDVANLRAQRLDIQKQNGDLDEWRAREQIEWAARFREHYARVARKAG